jgi:hypothetical protein
MSRHLCITCFAARVQWAAAHQRSQKLPVSGRQISSPVITPKGAFIHLRYTATRTFLDLKQLVAALSSLTLQMPASVSNIPRPQIMERHSSRSSY